jgi:hypothetical protein
MVVRLRIPDDAVQRVRGMLQGILNPEAAHHSVNTKIMRLNSVIGGWCRYYQYTSSPSAIVIAVFVRTYGAANQQTAYFSRR